jgi:hypothetical protein
LNGVHLILKLAIFKTCQLGRKCPQMRDRNYPIITARC